jgi:HEAT repeat protein
MFCGTSGIAPAIAIGANDHFDLNRAIRPALAGEKGKVLMTILHSKWFWLTLCAAITVAGAWAYLRQDELQARYEAWKLAHASDQERSGLVARLAQRPETAIAVLLSYLHSPDHGARGNCSHALSELAGQWTAASPETMELARQLVAEFASLSPQGRREAFYIAAAALTMPNDESAPPELTAALAHLLESAESAMSPEALPGALLLAIRFISQPHSDSATILKSCRQLVEAGLKDDRPECRAHAARLAAAPELKALDLVPPLILGRAADPDPEVRRTALVLIAGHEELAPIESLLPVLHDDSEAVRSVCAKALRGRGLTVEQIQLAKLLTDPRAAVRAQVPAKVVEFPDLDTRVWLNQLSRDSSPAVRAAVIRTFGEHQDAHLRDRIREMATADPSSTIRQLAEYYLTHNPE